MHASKAAVSLDSFTSFGDLLLYLRRRAYLRQRDLAIAVGYSEAQIGRLEKNQRLPNVAMVLAQFVPALDVADEPEMVARLVELARAARHEPAALPDDTTVEITGARGDQEVTAETGEPLIDLPYQPTPLLGRGDELALLARLLADPDRRCVTITGPGGIGKTSVALEATRHNAHLFRHGVGTVMLASVATVDLLVPTIAESLHLPLASDADALPQLRRYLRDKSVLLLLDNLEHLVESAPELAALLAAAPGLKLLVTSRERLRIRGEVTVELGGLPVPPNPFARDVTQYSAFQLFVASAQRVQPDFVPSGDDQAAIVDICQVVDGHPLAIELAASWTHILPCPHIARQLRHNLDLLHTELRDVPARHRSIRAVFDHSWQLFSPQEQHMLCRLAVFSDEFSQAAAEAVCHDGSARNGTLLSILRGLVDKSVLRRVDAMPAARYKLHELVRHFVVERLAKQPEIEQEIYRRHGHYYAALVDDLEPTLKGPDQQEALAAMSRDIANIRAACQWALVHGDLGALQQVIAPMALFYEYRGWFREGETYWAQLVEHLRALHVPGRRAEEQMIVLGRALIALGTCRFRLGRLAEARAALHESETLLAPLQPRPALADARMFLGVVTATLGMPVEGRRLLLDSVALHEAAGDSRGVARGLYYLAVALLMQGEYVAAQQLLHESLARVTTVGDPRGTLRILNRLGAIGTLLGQYDEAQRVLQTCLLHASALGDQREMGIALQQLGQVAYDQHDYGVAQYFLNESLAHFDEVGDQANQARALVQLGRTMLEAGDRAGAQLVFVQARDIAHETRMTPLLLDLLADYAALLLASGDPEQSVAVLAHVIEHPASDQRTRDHAMRLLHTAEDRLTPYTFAAAQARGRATALDTLLAALEYTSLPTESERNQTRAHHE